MLEKKFPHLVIILLFFIWGFIPLLSQNDSDSTNIIQKRRNLRIKNPEGTEFWLCFEKNYKEPKRPSPSTDILLELFITGDENAHVNIEIDGIGYKQNFFVPGGTVKSIKIPSEAQVKSDEIVERLALHITSDKPVSVYGLNTRFQTTDTYLGLPTSVLGTEYRAMCYTVSESLMPEFAIVATEDNTEVTITLSVPTNIHPAKIPYTIYLKRGDVYQVASKNIPYSDCDLTGTLIKSNKKIAVFSGHQCAYVTPKIIACNHLVEEVPPIPSWGRHFFIGRLYPRSKYTFRVLANEPNTKVFQDNKLVRVLKDGEFYDSTVASDIQISASKPVLVAEYSQGFKNGDSIGDPMMLLISPTQQFLQQYRFATPINGYWKHCINVVAPTKGINTMKLDGEPLNPKIFKQLGLSRYSIAYIPVQFGSHFIEGDLPFGMYSYGFGYDSNNYDAYGTMGGQSFLEYEPANDTLPPMIEQIQAGNQLTLIVRDDRVDDSGIKDVNAIENTGLKLNVPNYSEGVPQLKLTIRPMSNAPGRMVFQARDVALNKTIISICYVFDPKTEKYTYIITDGIVEECRPDPGIQFGLFGRISAVYHYADFRISGNVPTPGRYSDAFGTGGYFGLLIGRRFTNNWLLSGRLTLENYGGTLEAPDDSISHMRTQDGSLRPVQQSSLLHLNGTFLQFGAAAEYYTDPNLYFLGGLNFTFTLSQSISYRKKILQPTDITYFDGTTETTPSDAPATMGSLNFLKLGILGGVGVNIPINYMFSGFAEATYNYYISNLISDGVWHINQFSLSLGVRMRY